MKVVTLRGRHADPNSMSSRIRALLAAGATPQEAAEQLGCTLNHAYRMVSRMRTNPVHDRPPSLAMVVRDALMAGRAPLAVAEQLGCDAGYVYKVRARMPEGTTLRAKGRARRRGAVRSLAAVGSHDSLLLQGLERLVTTASTLQREVAALRDALVRIADVVRAVCASDSQAES